MEEQDSLNENSYEGYSYKEKLEAMGMPHHYRESEGGHIWKNWRVYLSEFLPRLFQ